MNDKIYLTQLPSRSVLRVSGNDATPFLQGLISNDLELLKSQPAIYGALLTPQGKFLHDMFVIRHENSLLLDVEAARADDFVTRLRRYKLRAKVEIEPMDKTWRVYASWPAKSYDTKAELFPDPRLADLGFRIITETQIIETAMPQDYDRHRLGLGVSEGSGDMEIEKSTLIEGNYDFLNGISWTKGCYVGQELTARMHYRGLAKKRLFPVRITGKAPPTSATVMLDDSEAGEMRSSSGDIGLCLLRLDAFRECAANNKTLQSGNTILSPYKPDWMALLP